MEHNSQTSLQTLNRWAVAGLLFPLLILNIWLLVQVGTMLQPFTSNVIAACLIAFILDYPIQLLEQQGCPRGLAIAVVLLGTLLVITILVVFLGPLIWVQLNDFVFRLPGWVQSANKQLSQLDNFPFIENSPIDLRQLLDQASQQLSRVLQLGTKQLINVTLNTIDRFTSALITLVLSILLVVNGEALWDGLLSWLPQKWQTQVRQSFASSFRGYFSGQATLALISAAALSIAFVVVQIPFGLLFGLGIGLASIVPFGGTITITVVSILLLFQSVSLGIKLLTVALIIGQVNENVIAPRLIGEATGLNPAIVLVALAVGAKFFGFLGLVLAVPTASFIKKMLDTLRDIDALALP